MANYYWVGGDGTWDNTNTANWATSSGGAGGNGPPNNADAAYFDTNSGTVTVTLASTGTCLSTVQTGANVTIRLNADNSAFGTTGTYFFYNGVLDLNGYSLNVNLFTANNAAARTLAFGTTGQLNVGGNNATVFNVFTASSPITITGNAVVNLTYSGGTGTRTINSSTTGANISVNVKAGTDTMNLGSGWSWKDLDFTGFSGTLTQVQATLSGNVKFSTGMTINSGTNVWFFSGTSGTQTITSNGKTLDFPITFNGTNVAYQLQDNMTVGSTRTTTFTSGTLDLTGNSGNWTLSTGFFASNNTNTRSIIFGTGNITLVGNGATIWNLPTIGNFSYTGTPTVNCTYSGSTGTRTFNHGATSGGSASKAINLNVTAGTDQFTISTDSHINNIDMSGWAGQFGNGFFCYGDFKMSSGSTIYSGSAAMTFAATSTQNITMNGVSWGRPVTFDGVGGTFSLQDNLTVGSTRTTTLTNGTLALNGNSGNWTLSTGLFASSNSNARSINFGTGNITLTGSGTVWDTGTLTNLTYTGTPTVNVSNNSATATTVTTGAWPEATALNFNYTVGTYTLTDTNAVYKNVNFTGFTGTVGNAARTIYGNLTIAAGSTLTAGANATTFAATSGTQQITTNGKTLDFPLIFNGIGGTFAFQDALTQGTTRAFTLTNGTVQLKNGVTSTVGALATSGTNQKILQSTSAGSRATLSQASGAVNASNLTIRDIGATGGATFNAFSSNNNVDAGNNAGWDFGAALSRSLSRTWARSGDRSYSR